MSIPKHHIFASNGSTLIYTINNVIKRDPPIAMDIPKEIEITNLRGGGAITLDGGKSPYDMVLDIVIQGADYAALMTSIGTLKTTVLTNTNYYLKFDKTLINNASLESIPVRLKSISVDPTRGNLTHLAFVTLNFRALSW